MLNILSHQRNSNQNNSEIPSYTCQNGQYQKHWWKLMLERMSGKWNSPPLLVKVQTGAAALDINMVISYKIRKHFPQDPSIPLFLGIYPKDAQSYHKDICSIMFITALFVIARTWKQPKCSSIKEWIRKMWYIYTMEYYTAEKQWHLEICWEMDESRKHQIEWGNPDPERQISLITGF